MREWRPHEVSLAVSLKRILLIYRAQLESLISVVHGPAMHLPLGIKLIKSTLCINITRIIIT